MFRKLLSNLPFNPSLINQVSFYARRMHHEERLRRTGLVLVVLSVFVQLFAVLSPIEASNQCSTNDIIRCGIGTSNPKERLLQVLRDGDGFTRDHKAIFDHFKITEADIRNATLGTVNSGDHTLYSLGRNPHSSLDQKLPIGGSTTYLRPLYTWGDNKSYPALVGQRNNLIGTTDNPYFAVMIDCGNIVIKVLPKPNLTIVKHGLNHADNATVQRNELLQYRVFFNNIGAGAANSVAVTDFIPAYTTYEWIGDSAADKINRDHLNYPGVPYAGRASARYVEWFYNTMPAQRENWYADLNVKVNSDAPNGAKICNTAVIRALNHPPVEISNPVCYTVQVSTIATPTPTPVPVSGQPNISNNKLVSNLTKSQTDAHNQTAAPGDILEYKLLTINSGTATARKYDKLTDDVDDLLEYADVIEISNEGKLNDGEIAWKAVDIKSKETVTRTFKVKVKNPLPATPRSSSDPQSYDLQIDNTYGNTVTVKLAAPTVAKAVETAATTLPNTGPGETLAVAFVITVIVGYFFARSRLLAQELDIVREEFTVSGGI